MDLSRQLLKDFADVTRGVERDQTQYLRGTIKGSGEAKYVRIDGSESLTPISEVVDVQEGDRVLVTIENHEATILGNLTKPPSAYKEQEAIDKAEDAQESAEDASNKAENAQTLAKSASDKADAAVVDAGNASAAAEQAKQNAADAMTAAESANANSTEAKDLATAAGQNAESAREEAALAQNAATAAQGEVTRIEGVVTGVKGDIDTALKEVADQAADLQATKETLEVTYAKKTEVSDVQAALTTEISKKVGELQTTVSQTYAAKNDVVEMEGRLQSQITQTSGEVSSVVGKVEQLESDTTEAKKKVDEALEKSAAAQVAAGQAQANATAAQTAADAAKANADNATKKANEAVQNAANAAATAAEADRKVSAAKTDLAEAKVNLENTMNRVGATEQEIADAQKKVDAAQAAVTQAQKEAAEATLAANNAQSAANKAQTDATEAQNAATNAQKKADNAALAAGNAQAAADKAQQDVAALTKRVTSAETAITQNSEQIKLAATKTEEIGTKLDNLQVGGRNLVIGTGGKFGMGYGIPTTAWEDGRAILKYGSGNNPMTKTEILPQNGAFDEFVMKRGVVYTQSLIVETDATFVPNGEFDFSWFRMSPSAHNYKRGNIKKTGNEQYLIWCTASVNEDNFQLRAFDVFNLQNVLNFHNSGSYIAFSKPKLEEGNTPTAWTPAPEDQQSQIDGINNNLTNNYYSKTQTDAAIKVASDNVTTTVRKEVTTEITNVNKKVDNLQVGGRNLIINSEKYTKDNPWQRTIRGGDDYTMTDMYFPVVKDREYTFQFCTNRPIGWHQLDGTAKGTMHIMLFLQTQDMVGTNNYKRILDLNNSSLVSKNDKYYQTFTIPTDYEYVRARIRIDGHADGTEYDLRCWNFQAEEGNKDTTWNPPVESMATEGEVQQAQNTANEANGKADATENRVSVAESTIKQLSDSISMLVTDSNGSSMMTQTSDGWTFNIGSISEAINNATNNISNLTTSVEQANNTIDNLNQLANDLSAKTAYINMSTDETGAPCIELGKTGNAFKVRITNTSVDFIEGSSKIAYVSNRSLYIARAIIKDELQIGDGTGFILKRRSNGNLGLRWANIPRVFITPYKYSQTSIDTYSKSGYTGSWVVIEDPQATGISSGDKVKLGILNITTGLFNYIEATVNSFTNNSINTTSTGVVTDF